jgi:hypothetical protein
VQRRLGRREGGRDGGEGDCHRRARRRPRGDRIGRGRAGGGGRRDGGCKHHWLRRRRGCDRDGGRRLDGRRQRRLHPFGHRDRLGSEQLGGGRRARRCGLQAGLELENAGSLRSESRQSRRGRRAQVRLRTPAPHGSRRSARRRSGHSYFAAYGRHFLCLSLSALRCAARRSRAAPTRFGRAENGASNMPRRGANRRMSKWAHLLSARLVVASAVATCLAANGHSADRVPAVRSATLGVRRCAAATGTRQSTCCTICWPQCS